MLKGKLTFGLNLTKFSNIKLSTKKSKTANNLTFEGFYAGTLDVIILLMPKKLLRTTTIVIFSFLFLGSTAFAGTTPPTTTSVQTPATPDGNNDWYVTPVTFDLTATDLESGVASINYRVDQGTWQQVNFSDSLNLAPNPSFETSGATSSGLASWEATLVDGNTTYSQDTLNSAPSYPSSSAKIVTTGGAGVWHGINNKVTFAVAGAYENMTASLWMKTENVNESAYFRIYSIADDGFGGELVTLLGTSSALSGTTGWTFLSLDFIALPDLTTGIYMDIGLEGAGTVWADAATINSSSQVAKTQIIIASDSADHTLEFYSVDQIGNAEASSCTGTKVNCVEFKLDSTPPGNWSGSGAVRGVGGAEHELFVFTNVDDATSGLSPNTDQYQYTVDVEATFGRYEELIQCNTPWQEGVWASLGSTPPTGGENTMFLQTQKTDFCNSNWKICKTVRFYAEDMAGNFTEKDFCINGPWIRVRGEGVVRANHDIDMLSEPEGDNTDGLIEVGGNGIDFFTSTVDWEITGSPIPNFKTYDDYWALTSNQTEIANGRLVSADGTYFVNGNFEIDNQAKPNDYDNSTFNQVVFINGDLTISADIQTDATAAALFIVKGNVDIAKIANIVQIGIFSDGVIDTAYDISEGQSTQTLELNGLYSADQFVLSRTLQGTNNDDNPSEDIIYEPKFLIQLKDFFGKHTVTWRSAE